MQKNAIERNSYDQSFGLELVKLFASATLTNPEASSSNASRILLQVLATAVKSLKAVIRLHPGDVDVGQSPGVFLDISFRVVVTSDGL